MNNIAQAFLEAAHDNPDGTALVCKGVFSWQKLTFRDLEELAGSYCDALRHEKICPGDRVMLMVKPSPDFIALSFALFSLGAVVILIDPGMGYKNLLKCIGSVKPSVFIGIPKAHLFKLLFPKPFRTVHHNFCVGPTFGLFGRSLRRLPKASSPVLQAMATKPDDLAAILFTTGSTGPPKGVQYQHSTFLSQLGMIRDYYGIRAGDVDQPAFPFFALFSIALGATAVLPDMDPAKPAKVNPAKFTKSIRKFGVTYSFGSPTIWNVVGRYCLAKNITLPTLTKVLMAGAPVPGDLIERTKSCLGKGAEVHVPYGATECLPIISMTGSEVVECTWALTKEGKGTCVGRPLPDITVYVISSTLLPIPQFSKEMILPVGEVGEIIVRGKVVTKAYDHNPSENAMAKISDPDGGFWHRIGDMGYFDAEGRLWFCGRKAHRVLTQNGPHYSVCCEAVFNNHPEVYRSALVGVGQGDDCQPVLIVEPHKKNVDTIRLCAELKDIARRYEHTADIELFMVKNEFPVDIRHNAKIFREKLAIWAADELQGDEA